MRFLAAAMSCCIGLGGAASVASSQTRPASAPAPPPDARVTPQGWFPAPDVDHPELPQTVQQAFVIPIHGPITATTAAAVERKVIRCRGAGAELVIFDMDTPGGQSGAMLDIVRLILDGLRDTYTVAYVNPEAFSAGAIISLACEEIVVSPTAVIGDAMPIMVGPGGQLQPIPPEERGKIESAMRAEVRTLAKNNGYSVPLCEGMIDMSMELWLVRRIETRELRIVEADEWRQRVANPPEPTDKPREDAEWELLRVVDDAEEIVTATADEAVFLGLASGSSESLDALQEQFNVAGAAEVLADTWSERLVAFLTSPAVASVLLFVGLLMMYTEINSPGFGVPGALAVLCFAVLFGSQFLTGLAQWWEIGLFALGVVLLALEVFVIPGFGVAGIAGLLCMGVGLLAMFVSNAPDELPIPTTDLDWGLLADGVIAVALGFMAAVVGAVVIAQYLPKVPVANKFFLAPAEGAGDAPAAESSPVGRIAAGDVGVVEGMCRPVGTVRFGEDLLSAVAEGQYIEPGRKVRVLERRGNRVVVEPAEEA